MARGRRDLGIPALMAQDLGEIMAFQLDGHRDYWGKGMGMTGRLPGAG